MMTRNVHDALPNSKQHPSRIQFTNNTTAVNLKKCPISTIIIPVFNALEYVQRCVESVLKHTDLDSATLLLVNDGSNRDTKKWLDSLDALNPDVQLIHNSENIGYTRSINRGLEAAAGSDYVILLNSDTIVTRGWLDKLKTCAESSAEIGIVGPLSNAASWQSVPELFDDKRQFAINILPENMDVDEYASLIKKLSKQSYPRTQFVNGFCFLMKKEVIEALGEFDEIHFPRGYGEENDYCVRAQKCGYALAIADNCYVFHAKSKSFGHKQRTTLSRQGDINLRKKHGNTHIHDLVNQQKSDTSLDYLRLSLLNERGELDAAHIPDFQRLRLLFVLPVSGGGGGSHSIVQETVALRRLGIQCSIAVQHQNLQRFYELYSDIKEYQDIFIAFNQQTITDIAATFDIVIGTIYHSLGIVQQIIKEHPHILPAYYIQDYEPYFFEEGSEQWQRANDSYTLIPNAALFAKTHWIAQQVEHHHGLRVLKVNPSIDHEVYYPGIASAKNTLTLTAMIRPKTPYRGAERTMELFHRLQTEFSHLDLHTFGCDVEDEDFQAIPQDFSFQHHGILKRSGVAELLRKTDIFIDLSDYQAFGRTALEAMACGATAVVPHKGGTAEYARDNTNALIVDTLDERIYTKRIRDLISNPEKILEMKLNGLMTAARFSPHAAAVSEWTALYKELRIHRLHHPVLRKPTIWVLPSFRDDGLPAGSAYVRLYYPLNSRKLKNNWAIRFATQRELPSPKEADIAIIQRDAAAHHLDKIRKWAEKWKHSGNKIIFEIDDNLLDEKGIKQRSNANTRELVTTTTFMARMADQIIVSTPELKKRLRKYNPNIQVQQNKLDQELWRIAKDRLTGKDVFPKGEDDVIRIGYIGTPTHTEDLELIKKAIKKIEKKYKKKVSVEVIGAFQRDRDNPLFGEAVALPSNTSYPAFVEWLHKRVNWDIAVIPLVDDVFNKSKSHLKFLECTALGMACICSDVPSYNRIVKHGKNGLLCKNTTRQWYKSIQRLIRDKDYRERLAKTAYQLLSDEYTTTSSVSEYDDLFNKTLRIQSKSKTISSTPIRQSLIYRLYPYLHPEYEKELTLSQRRVKKLYRDPYLYFYDSKTKPLRYLRYFFRKRNVHKRK